MFRCFLDGVYIHDTSVCVHDTSVYIHTQQLKKMEVNFYNTDLCCIIFDLFLLCEL